MRKEYVIGNSKMECDNKDDKTTKPKTTRKTTKKTEEKKSTLKKGIYLFGTKTCPNCKMAKKFLEDDDMKYTFIDAEEEKDLTKNYSIKQAPTLLVIDGKAKTDAA